MLENVNVSDACADRRRLGVAPLPTHIMELPVSRNVGPRVCASVFLRHHSAHDSSDDDGAPPSALLVFAPNSLGALVQRVRAHFHLRIADRSAREKGKHSIAVFSSEGERLTSATFAGLLAQRSAWALTHVAVVLVLHRPAEAAPPLHRRDT